eukprot:TRINITY_DN1014_c0_g1_i5.p1 TRINITY_DN1014_c0_g1~~TRINITY_DN1014_c0_g1_i5.p1  ORF type:complete len:206 (+),score=14.15 TRINITY_DN1014_c0_g1_i5:598-1215(+)
MNTEFLNISSYRMDAEATLVEAARFLSHPKLVEKQSQVVFKILQSTQSLPCPPRVIPVSLPDPSLRGCCGIKAIYVNLTAFQNILQFDFLCADLCTVLAHESTHFYLRRIEGDWNFSSLAKLAALNVPVADREAGRLLELDLFHGKQPDWLQASLLPQEFGPDLVHTWVTSALNHTTLPLVDFSKANRMSSTRGFDEQEIVLEEF